MSALLNITRVTKNSPAVGRKAHTKILAYTNRWIVEDWHERLRPMRFTPAGARSLGYRRRHTKDVFSGRVRRSKSGKPLAPNGNPLVWSGYSRNASRQANIRANSKSSSVTMPVRAFNFRPSGNKSLNMRAEFLTVAKNEVAEQERRASVVHERTVSRYVKSQTRRF